MPLLTNITFCLVSDTEVNVLQNGNLIGCIWSEKTHNNKTLPYPNEKMRPDCLSSIQICGFKTISETWSCGIFKGTKDVVVIFEDAEEQKRRYKIYVEKYIRKNNDISGILNFEDWKKQIDRND